MFSRCCRSRSSFLRLAALAPAPAPTSVPVAVPTQLLPPPTFRVIPSVIRQPQQRSSYSTWNTHAPMNPAAAPSRKKVTINSLRNLYESGVPITMVTAHDFPSASVAEHAGVDMILVGDSLAMVGLGMEVRRSPCIYNLFIFSLLDPFCE